MNNKLDTLGVVNQVIIQKIFIGRVKVMKHCYDSNIDAIKKYTGKSDLGTAKIDADKSIHDLFHGIHV